MKIFDNLLRKKKEWSPPSEQEFFSDIRKIKNFQNNAIRAFQENRNYFDANIPRQTGKTFIGLRIALWSALSKPQSNSFVITRKIETASFFLRELEKIFERLDIPYEKMTVSRHKIVLPNKSVISFVTSSFRNEVHFRGENFGPWIDFIYYDEYDWFDRSQLSEMLNTMKIDNSTIHLGLSSNYFEESLNCMFPKERK